MEYAKELVNEEKKQERRNERLSIQNGCSALRNYYPSPAHFSLFWNLTVFKEISKRPKLTNDYQCYKSSLAVDDVEAHIKFILIFIENYQRLIKENGMDEFLQGEFLKVVYDYIKIELAYNGTSSRILNYIIENNFNKEVFISMVRDDIEEINKSSFVDIEFLKYLHMSIKVHDLLSPQVIRNIVMCADYELIKEASKNTLEHNKANVSTNLSRIRIRLRNEIAYKKEGIKDKRKIVNQLLFKRTIVSFALIATIAGITFGAKSMVDDFVETNVPPKFKTTYTTYSNVASPSVEEIYSEVIRDNNATLKIYSEAYLENGILYRDIKMYDVEGFTDTSVLDKYFSYDFSIIKPIDIDNKVKVKENEMTEEYRELTIVTQDKEDVIHSMSTLDYIVFLMLTMSFLGCVPVTTEAIFIKKSNKIYKKKNEDYELLVEEARQKVQELNGDIDKIGKFLKESITLCDEMIGKEDLEELTEEEKELIKQYESIRKDYSELLDEITTDEINIYIKKYEKKHR